MGNLLFFIILIFEIAFAMYCIVSKKSHQKLRSGVRIAAFFVFVILILSSVIVWSFRWVLLAIFLFILAGIGTISLIRNNLNNREYKTSRIIGKGVFMTLMLVFTLIPILVFPQYKSPQVTGSYDVATATYTYTDKSRMEEFKDTGKNRFLNVKFWYPKNADESYPLLVFSHGANGIKESNTSTYMELASHGYVVCSIDHSYHSFYTVADNGSIALISSEYMKEFRDSNKEGIYTKAELYQLIQKWMKLRTDDMNFVINTIIEKSKNDKDPVYQQINQDKIGVFGHSMGGAASVWVGRERKDVSAVVNIDAPFFSELAYNQKRDDFEAKDEAYTIPLLNIYSDDVWKQLDTNSVYAANRLTNNYFKEAYTVHFQGAKHLSLTDLPLVSPLLANMLQGGKADIDSYYCIETENELILQFFDATLKGIGRFTSEGTYGPSPS
ncbi:alpha/beta hydrolase [Paenibacillus sp. UMB4589-SE434]|uniref:alpha/beta hydrolase family protein n=1 Tax=Paenibacillus sp. UMB4589-SE434 TaxID=3046314 RepID=UPI00254A950B|nr:alpha/beta hydrolase [Paenibacillus sp. UMB4589-SE434]MDK8183546.1 alpha/beta hydrolase [Paenibacillus sp. UMB4589-SE434]